MFPTRTPQSLEQGRFPIPAMLISIRPGLLCMCVISAMLAAATNGTFAADPAVPPVDEKRPAPTEEGAAVSPPTDEETVPDPPDWNMQRAADVPPATGESGPRLRCDDCCAGCDECCPISGGEWEWEGCDQDLCCFAPGCDGCDALWGCPDASFYVGLEFGVLKPDVDRLRVPGTTTATSVKPDHGYEFAPRFFAGFQGCDGWGGQINYWTLETGANRTDLPQVFHDLDLQTVDIDVTKTCEMGEWMIQIGAGGRWGNIESNYFDISNPNQRFQIDFEGTGPTAVLNVRRPLGCGHWALVGEGRASFLYGTTNVNTPLAPNLQLGDDWVEIWEGRAGIEWNGPSASGDAVFFVRALFEGQYWNLPGMGTAGSPDMNFLGPTLSAGFVF